MGSCVSCHSTRVNDHQDSLSPSLLRTRQHGEERKMLLSFQDSFRFLVTGKNLDLASPPPREDDDDFTLSSHEVSFSSAPRTVVASRRKPGRDPGKVRHTPNLTETYKRILNVFRRDPRLCSQRVTRHRRSKTSKNSRGFLDSQSSRQRAYGEIGLRASRNEDSRILRVLSQETTRRRPEGSWSSS